MSDKPTSRLTELIRMKLPWLGNSKVAKQMHRERDQWLRSLDREALEVEYYKLYPKLTKGT